MSVIPKNETAEQSALACLLSGASPFSVPLRSEHFAAPDNRLVFDAVCAVAEEGQPVTLASVTSYLTARGELEAAGGPPARHLAADVAAGGDAVLAYYFDDLESARRNRAAVLHIRKHLADLSALRVDAAQFAEELAEVAAPVSVAANDDSAAEILAAIEAREARGEQREVFPSGLGPLDRHLGGGWHRGELAVVAGGTGGGKSALLIQAAAACANDDKKVRYFTIELPKEDVFDRMACALRGVSAPDIKKFNAARCALGALPLKIHGSFTTLAEISGEIRAAVRAGDCDVAVVDYIQRVSHKADTRELEVSAIARTLKTLALRENIVVLTASQLNDNGLLRESRAVGHEADFVLTIGDDGLRVDKFRRGPHGDLLPCHLLGAQSRFVPTARDGR